MYALSGYLVFAFGVYLKVYVYIRVLKRPQLRRNLGAKDSDGEPLALVLGPYAFYIKWKRRFKIIDLVYFT